MVRLDNLFPRTCPRIALAVGREDDTRMNFEACRA